jgi:hypothetical protein
MNIIHMLMTTFNVINNIYTVVNHRKLKLYNILKDVVIGTQKGTLFSLEDVALEFTEVTGT